MTKEEIHLFRLEESPLGVELAYISDEAVEEHVYEQILAPHRHDHYCCFLLESGHIDFTIDFYCLQLKDACLLVSCPGQIHQLGLVKEASGWMLAFEARLIGLGIRSIIEQSFAKAALLNLDPVEKEWFSSLISLIH